MNNYHAYWVDSPEHTDAQRDALKSFCSAVNDCITVGGLVLDRENLEDLVYSIIREKAGVSVRNLLYNYIEIGDHDSE